MSINKAKVSSERIEEFLEGSDQEQYIVAIEASYGEPIVTLVINDPERGKYTREVKFKPFLWFKEEIGYMLYNRNKKLRLQMCTKYGVSIKRLRTKNDDGFSPKRLENGYKYMAICTKSQNDLIRFFKEGGFDVFDKETRENFVMFSPVEQFMIQTGKRLFKGIEDYDGLHRFQFDLETEGLFAAKNAIFQIGVRDNRNLDTLLETEGETYQQKRDSEREMIAEFFRIINEVKPDIIAGYNSENFDWPYLFERAERLSISIETLAKTLHRAHKIKRKQSTVKFGGETEHYMQTSMFGYNVIDVSHAVRRAMAINSEIKAWGLKYITQYSEIAKPNRVYVAGDKINSTWADKENKYAFNDEDGDWYMITDKKPMKEGYEVKTGAYIVQRYLSDDLWETEQIDNIFNQASFLIGKMLPTTYQRSSTMGTAGQWKLIMAAWSYENGLAIPETQKKRDFTGGLSRLLEVGYARNVVKLDFAALYPKIQLTHLIFPDLDITGMMEGTLTYVVDTRDKYKFLTGEEKVIYKGLEKKLKAEKANMTPEDIAELKKQIDEHKALANLYDKKQLPLKILANSWFGSYGAPYIFNWGDTDSAEETTCRGRQYLRLMVRHFTEKYGFRGLVLDTDGANFASPDNIDEIKYIAKGSHWKTDKNAGVELVGLEAVLAEFNENYMEGRMGLDIDDVCNSTINFARKNYANDIGGKIKLVGNSVKSKKMSVYIEEFLGKSIRMLLDGDGHSFINFYYEYVDKIYNYQIPLVKIASKAKIKHSIDDYRKKSKKLNKAGNPMPRQAHMELAIRDNLGITLGDTLFYINTGSAKSHGDLKTVDKNKMTKKERDAYFSEHGEYPKPNKVVELNCKLIDPETVERDFELLKELNMLKASLQKIDEDGEGDLGRDEIEQRIELIDNELYTDEYNVSRYLDAFNKKVRPLLVCFHPDIRSQILLDIVKVKDKVTKKVTESLKDRAIFTHAQCSLVCGMANKPTDQDSYEDLMRMEDKEIRFWDSVDMIPNNMEDYEWEEIRADWKERMRLAKIEGVQHEKELIDTIFKELEVSDYNSIVASGELPKNAFAIVDVSEDYASLTSRKWDEVICPITDIFKYESIAIERDAFYKQNKLEKNDNRYNEYLDYLTEQEALKGKTLDLFDEPNDELVPSDITPNEINTEIIGTLLKEKAGEVILTKEEKEKKKRKLSESEDEDDSDVSEEEDDNGDVVRTDDVIQRDDDFDDTYAELPEDYEETDELSILEVEEEVLEKKEDEWGF
jgi:DNA polymerase elongation subunit (family B)